MTQLYKLLDKAQRSKHNFKFDELCQLVEKVGFVLRGQPGTSHRIYKHPYIQDIMDSMVNIQNCKGMAKPSQIKNILSVIEKHDLVREREDENEQIFNQS